MVNKDEYIVQIAGEKLLQSQDEDQDRTTAVRYDC